MRRGGPLRRTGRLKPKSAKTQERDAAYSIQRYVFLGQHSRCAGWWPGCTRWATDVHHMRGRVGALMLDEANWAPLCRTCHQHVTEHPRDNAALIEAMLRRAEPLPWARTPKED